MPGRCPRDLIRCWMTRQRHPEADAAAFLRKAIRRYNEATGVVNTETAGYHETLTRYYVGAVAGLRAASIDEVLEAPECQIDAPLRFWSRDRLFSVDARARWAGPDLMPLPTRPR